MSTTSDTLVLDQQFLRELREDNDYNQDIGRNDNPNYEIQPIDVDLPDADVSGASKAFKIFSIVFITLFILAAVGYIMYRRLATVEERQKITLPDEDTIYGIDFETTIRQMEEKGDYYQCIRLRYLAHLRHLHDARRIFWLPSKTPSEYVQEMNSDSFRRLTNIFLKVRYGNYPASATLYTEVTTLVQQTEATEGGAE